MGEEGSAASFLEVGYDGMCRTCSLVEFVRMLTISLSATHLLLGTLATLGANATIRTAVSTS